MNASGADPEGAGQSVVPLPPLTVAGLFAPLLEELSQLLRGLSPAEWGLPVSRAWVVRDVVAHLLDGDCRQLSFGRDRLPLLPPDRPLDGPEALLDFLDGLNASWVAAAKRLSPALLVDLLGHTGRQAATYFAALDPLAPAIFAVAWAGQSTSPNWLHLGRELTERWHHQQQIRSACGRPLLAEARFARPVLETFLYGLPPAYENVEAPPGSTVEIRFLPPVDSCYGLVKAPEAWVLSHPGARPAARIELDFEAGWLALTRSIPVAEARHRARVSGPDSLTAPFFRACSIHKRPV